MVFKRSICIRKLPPCFGGGWHLIVSKVISVWGSKRHVVVGFVSISHRGFQRHWLQ
jgi:hypothetical protein